MPDTDINPLLPVRTLIDPDRRQEKKKEEQHEKKEEEEETGEENVIVDIGHAHDDPHAHPVDNRSRREISHEKGKGESVDFTV